MSNAKLAKNPSHLILTLKQKEQLRSIPISEFTDKEWESPNDAASFLREHNLILENKRKWNVRYSEKSKNIILLQCCCGSDRSLLRQKNGKTKNRKSRQMYEFVGCLAYARIKKYKNNRMRVTGYLRHLEDCLSQNLSFILRGNIRTQYPNAFYDQNAQPRQEPIRKTGIKNVEYETKTNELFSDGVKNDDDYVTETEESKIFELIEEVNDELKTKKKTSNINELIDEWEESNDKLIPWDEFYRYLDQRIDE